MSDVEAMSGVKAKTGVEAMSGVKHCVVSTFEQVFNLETWRIINV